MPEKERHGESWVEKAKAKREKKKCWERQHVFMSLIRSLILFCLTLGSISYHSGLTLAICSEAKWMSQVYPESGLHCMKSTRLKYAVEIWRYYLSDRLNNRYQIVTGGGWIATGSTGWKTMGTGDAKALIEICLPSGIDHIKGVAKFVLILQVFSSFSVRLSLLVPREGLNKS